MDLEPCVEGLCWSKCIGLTVTETSLSILSFFLSLKLPQNNTPTILLLLGSISPSFVCFRLLYSYTFGREIVVVVVVVYVLCRRKQTRIKKQKKTDRDDGSGDIWRGEVDFNVFSSSCYLQWSIILICIKGSNLMELLDYLLYHHKLVVFFCENAGVFYSPRLSTFYMKESQLRFAFDVMSGIFTLCNATHSYNTAVSRMHLRHSMHASNGAGDNCVSKLCAPLSVVGIVACSKYLRILYCKFIYMDEGVAGEVNFFM